MHVYKLPDRKKYGDSGSFRRAREWDTLLFGFLEQNVIYHTKQVLWYQLLHSKLQH